MYKTSLFNHKVSLSFLFSFLDQYSDSLRIKCPFLHIIRSLHSLVLSSTFTVYYILLQTDSDLILSARIALRVRLERDSRKD